VTFDRVSEKCYTNPVAGFTKLFSSLIFSTVWREEMHVKVVWITMLAMANRNGEVLASVPGLADAARVTLEQCQDALKKLAAPDEWSRTKEHEGRRIIEVDGGWRLLNYPKYREIRDADERRIQTRENVRAYRERKKAATLTVSRISPRKPRKAQAEAEADTEESKPSRLPAGDSWVSDLGKCWLREYEGQPAYGQIGKHLKSLVTKHGLPEVTRRWQLYLQATAAKFASPARFAQTFGAWTEAGGAPASDGYVSADDARVAFRKAGIPDNWAIPAEGYQSRVALNEAIRLRLEKLQPSDALGVVLNEAQRRAR
jgi:hypothetical protein